MKKVSCSIRIQPFSPNLFMYDAMRYPIAFFLSLLIYIQLLVGNDIDSLNNQLFILQDQGKELEAMETLIAIGEEYHETLEHRKAFNHFDRALQIALKNGLKEKEVQLKAKMGYELFWQDNYQDALNYMFQAEDEKDILDTENQSQLFSRIAEVFTNLGDYTQAASYQFEALKLSESVSDSLGIAYAHWSLSRVYWYSGQLDKAYEEAHQAYLLFLSLERTNALYSTVAALGSIQIERGNLEEAEDLINQSLGVARRMEYAYGEAFSIGMMGEVFKAHGELDTAEYYILKAIGLFEEKGIRMEMAEFEKSLSEVYTSQGRYSKAIYNLKNSLKTALQIDASALQRDIYKMLAENYEKQGNTKIAYDFLNRHYVLKDSLINEENQKQLSNLKKQYEIEKKERELEFLQQETALGQNRLYTYGFGTGLILLLVIIWLLLTRYRSQSHGHEVLLRKNEEIAYQNEQLTHLNEDLLEFSELVTRDLQGPLANIQDVCKRLSGNTVEQEDVDTVKTNLGKMEEVLYGLVMYSVTGSKEDAFEVCNTKEIVAEALNELPPHVKSKSAKIALQALPEVFANRKKLSQLFQHLITFSMAHQDSPSSTIYISGEEKGELYEFCIRNSGTRISSEKASELFKIFSGKEEGEYTGLELAVSRKIVEQHKGRLWINTHDLDGTSFYFAIPKEEYLESDPAK
ncbi:MAG: ATP-binding protein [Bacteroidota bacterium]